MSDFELYVECSLPAKASLEELMEFDAWVCKKGIKRYIRKAFEADHSSFGSDSFTHVLIEEVKEGFRTRFGVNPMKGLNATT